MNKPKVYLETSIPSYLTARQGSNVRVSANREATLNGRLIQMWNDPIVEETRKRREKYAEKFNHDIDAIYEDILKRQNQSGKKIVSFPPRTSSKKPNAA